MVGSTCTGWAQLGADNTRAVKAANPETNRRVMSPFLIVYLWLKDG